MIIEKVEDLLPALQRWMPNYEICVGENFIEINKQLFLLADRKTCEFVGKTPLEELVRSLVLIAQNGKTAASKRLEDLKYQVIAETEICSAYSVLLLNSAWLKRDTELLEFLWETYKLI